VTGYNKKTVAAFTEVRENSNSKWKGTELNKALLHLKKQHMSTVNSKQKLPLFPLQALQVPLTANKTRPRPPMAQVQNSGNVKKDNIQRCC